MRASRTYINALMNTNRTSSSRRRTRSNSSKNNANRYVAKTSTANKATGTVNTYQNMRNSAGEVQFAASKLTGTGDNSLFAKAKESGDTTDITNQVKEFVNQYNNMVRNLKNGSSRVDSSYLNQLNSYAAMSRDALQATGVTRQSDGTLKVDNKALQGASLEQLQKAWGGSSSFAAKAGTTASYVQSSAVSSLNSLVNNSYSNILRNFGASGNFFNFFS